MKNALNNKVDMLGNMFLWLVANLKQGVIYFINRRAGIIKLHECNFGILLGKANKIVRRHQITIYGLENTKTGYISQSIFYIFSNQEYYYN